MENFSCQISDMTAPAPVVVIDQDPDSDATDVKLQRGVCSKAILDMVSYIFLPDVYFSTLCLKTYFSCTYVVLVSYFFFFVSLCR